MYVHFISIIIAAPQVPMVGWPQSVGGASYPPLPTSVPPPTNVAPPPPAYVAPPPPANVAPPPPAYVAPPPPANVAPPPPPPDPRMVSNV